jgi:hypothetical protein
MYKDGYMDVPQQFGEIPRDDQNINIVFSPILEHA